MLTTIAILLVALVALLAVGNWIIRLLQNITAAFGVSEFTAAFFLLAIATSIPELFLAISSAKQDAGSVVIALALGSNIVNVTLIIGLATIVSSGIVIRGRQLKNNIALSLVLSVLPLVFLVDGVISRTEGVVLVLAFVAYLIVMYRYRKLEVTQRNLPRRIGLGLVSILVLFGLLVVLIFAAEKTVESSVQLAEFLHLSPFIIGLFLLAVGTSLPEMTTTLQSARRRRPEMALGNILGSDAADSTLVVGIAAIVRPLHVPLEPHVIITCIFVVVATIALGYFTLSRQRLSITEGLFLFFLFILFVFTIFITAPAALLEFGV